MHQSSARLMLKNTRTGRTTRTTIFQKFAQRVTERLTLCYLPTSKFIYYRDPIISLLSLYRQFYKGKTNIISKPCITCPCLENNIMFLAEKGLEIKSWCGYCLLSNLLSVRGNRAKCRRFVPGGDTWNKQKFGNCDLW